jgi:hypothetical protein
MVHDPATLTLQAALEAFYEISEEGVWTEMFRQARCRAKADKITITEALQADLVLRLKN